MDFLPVLVEKYNLDLQPSHSERIDVQSADTLLYPGAHIAASIRHEHFHHGIVIDPAAPDISIMHLWGRNKNVGRVQMTTMPIFLAGNVDNLGKKTRELYLVNYDGDTYEKQKETVKVAKELLEKADDIVYDLATLNCESFACFCRTGRWDSEQVTKIKHLLKDKLQEIFQEVEDANIKDGQGIISLINAILTDVLSPTDKEVLVQLLEKYSSSL
ncbi:unnamed protein product [Didymodactylos carnosus]|uniref:LRAT domain-containing protein n=1 Tax=Didymodactylos carnosus TaxID=1234261 RepID=A0A814DJS4_9BILA|nr:unnamed protein product [Didymodactylos carnosus]CAF0956649.1 unnamed protein product [Didymodactylos carnosus]CAF3709312.1 unnamed protein product [Didymodactylos carnosus]CAF3731600.1 unnamed protein product [Didymodactylos carnosus]